MAKQQNLAALLTAGVGQSAAHHSVHARAYHYISLLVVHYYNILHIYKVNNSLAKGLANG